MVIGSDSGFRVQEIDGGEVNFWAMEVIWELETACVFVSQLASRLYALEQTCDRFQPPAQRSVNFPTYDIPPRNPFFPPSLGRDFLYSPNDNMIQVYRLEHLAQ